MSLTAEQLKTVIIEEIGVSPTYMDKVNELWPLWELSSPGDELQLKRRLLSFLLGKYKELFETTRGRERNAAQQKFQQTERLLSEVNRRINEEGGGVDITLGSVRLDNEATVGGDCYEEPRKGGYIRITGRRLF